MPILRETTLADVIGISGPLWRGPVGFAAKNRFVVIPVSGRGIHPKAISSRDGNPRSPIAPSYGVLDSPARYADVELFPTGDGVNTRLSKERAHSLAARLNAEERAA